MNRIDSSIIAEPLHFRRKDLNVAEGAHIPATKLVLLNSISRNYDGSLSESPQMGLVYIATTAKRNNYDVSILAGDDLYKQLLEVCTKDKLQCLVGFYTNSDNIHEVLRLAQFIKINASSAKTIFGGPLASVDYESLIQSSYVDFVARGDGEELVLELLSAMEISNHGYNLISGLVWKDQMGNVVCNPQRSPFRQLDSIPIPDRTLYPLDCFGLKSQLVTSRGCGFKCTFCFESTNRKYRAHSPERVIEEIKQLKENYGTKYFTIVDDIFTTDHKRLRKICDLFRKEFSPHKDFFWYCEARVDTLAKFPDLIPLMSEAGLVRIQIGTESGSQSVIDAYKKHIKLDQIYETVKQCADSNILSVFTNFIIGGALETEGSFESTKKLALDLLDIAPGVLELNTTFLSPYPGTDIANNPEKYEIKLIDKDFVTGLSDDYMFVETNSLSKERIKELERSFMRTIRKKMLEQIPNISVNHLLRHLQMNKFGLQTQWSDIARKDSILNGLHKLLNSAAYSRCTDIDSQKIKLDSIPIRTFSLRDWHGGSYTWFLMDKKIELNEYEYFILELCGGKLSFSEIASKCTQYWNGSVSNSAIHDDLQQYLLKLSYEGLIVFRKTFSVR